MRSILLPRYGRAGASSRLRLLQYLGDLEAVGFSAQVRPFFDDEYLTRLYGDRFTGVSVLHAYLSRLRGIGESKQGAALFWVEKEVLPWSPWLIERALLPAGVPLAVDYDDAVFHNYDLHGSGLVRALLGRKIDRVMASSALVTAGNGYLADRARAAGARRVEVVPTVVDIEAYAVRDVPRSGSSPRIGWIGTPSTWREYMAPMMPALSDIARRHGVRISAVGPGKAASADPSLDILPWSETTEVAQIRGMDIGIMPLNDTPWARGKCGYKLIQYMACGLPVVASPVGVNAQIVEHGVNGFLANTEAEWTDALATLLHDPALRNRMGAEGRRKVERQFSLQIWGPRVAMLLRDVVEGRGPG